MVKKGFHLQELYGIAYKRKKLGSVCHSRTSRLFSENVDSKSRLYCILTDKFGDGDKMLKYNYRSLPDCLNTKTFTEWMGIPNLFNESDHLTRLTKRSQLPNSSVLFWVFFALYQTNCDNLTCDSSSYAWNWNCFMKSFPTIINKSYYKIHSRFSVTLNHSHSFIIPTKKKTGSDFTEISMEVFRLNYTAKGKERKKTTHMCGSTII